METTMEKDEPKTFVNVLMEQDLLEKLDTMVAKNEQTRAGFIRLLIREAYETFQRDEQHKKNLAKALKIKAVE